MIISNLIAMLSSINFDDHSTFKTDEVHDIRPNRLLSLELQSHEAMGTQVVPQMLLGWRLAGTHGLGVCEVVHVLSPFVRSTASFPLRGLPSPPAPLPQAGEGGEDQRDGGGVIDFCCWPSDSLASSAMPASEPRMPVASIGSSSIFWFGDLAISFSAST
jgi:hypothetical protein